MLYEPWLAMIEAGPTVIVARRVRAESQVQFEQWNQRLMNAALQFEGYLGAEAQPPDNAHPDEWVNVYRFDRQDSLDKWLNSAKRAAIMAEGVELLDGATREQRIAQLTPTTDVVTAVMSKRIRADSGADYQTAHIKFEEAMSQFPGFVQCKVYEPVPGVQDDHITVFTFDTRAHLDQWLDSDERSEVLGIVAPLLEAEPTLNVVGGFAGWFAPKTSTAPDQWKTAVVVLLALYPTTLILSLIQRSLFPDVAWVPALFVSNVVGVAILTWALIPFVTRLLSSWLRS